MLYKRYYNEKHKGFKFIQNNDLVVTSVKEDMYLEKQEYDRDLYAIRVILTNLYNSIKVKDSTAIFGDNRFRILGDLYSIEGLFPFKFVIFMDTRFISVIYVIVFTNETEIKIDYNDLVAIYPECAELTKKSLVYSVRVINPITKSYLTIYDCDIDNDTEKKNVRSISHDRYGKYLQKIIQSQNKLVSYQDMIIDYFMNKIQSENESEMLENGKNPEFESPEGNFQIPFDPHELFNNLSNEDKDNLFHGKEVRFKFPNGFMRIKPIAFGEFPFNPQDRTELDSMHQQRIRIIKHITQTLCESIPCGFNPDPNKISKKELVRKFYEILEGLKIFQTQDCTELRKYLGSEEQFKRFVNNIIRQFIKTHFKM